MAQDFVVSAQSNEDLIEAAKCHPFASKINTLSDIEYIEKYFKVVTKDDQLVPMKLWAAQKHYLNNRTHKDIILKGRQMGITLGVMAGNSAMTFRKQHQRSATITHDDETSQFLLLNLQRFWDNLPGEHKPVMKLKSTSRKYFPDLDAYVYVDSAKSDSIGIGHTLNMAHLSEASRYPGNKARELFAGISQTVSKDGYITLESTPRGRHGLFYEMYQEAKDGKSDYKAFFYPWWWAPDYILPEVVSLKTDEKTAYCAEIMQVTLAKFLETEKSLMETYRLSPAHIAWRRGKILEIKELFTQEYPENDTECWLSQELAIISGSILKPYYTEIREGTHEGDYLTVWKDVQGGHQYVIGADVASGSARDFSVASVLDARNMEYVARIRGKLNTDLFAERLFELGLRYNNALTGVERIGHGHSVLKVLIDKAYPNLYYHVDYDEILKKNITDAGWKTSAKTKLPMVNSMIQAFRSHDLLSYSESLLQETSGLTWQGGVDSKIETPAGGHDDEFIAVSIALQLREQIPVSVQNERTGSWRYARVT